MIEALWIVNFASASDGGAGVVVFETGRVFGGDYAYAYTGEYQLKDGHIRARVRVRSHSGISSSIFGSRDDFEIDFTGKVDEQDFTLTGSIVGEPDQQMIVKFRRFAELPG